MLSELLTDHGKIKDACLHEWYFVMFSLQFIERIKANLNSWGWYCLKNSLFKTRKIVTRCRKNSPRYDLILKIKWVLFSRENCRLDRFVSLSLRSRSLLLHTILVLEQENWISWALNILICICFRLWRKCRKVKWNAGYFTKHWQPKKQIWKGSCFRINSLN